MKPMAQGLSWSDIGSVASYLANRQVGGVPTASLESPLCSGHPAPLTLSGSQWNGWGADGFNSRYQPEPGLTRADIPRLEVKWTGPRALLVEAREPSQAPDKPQWRNVRITVRLVR